MQLFNCCNSDDGMRHETINSDSTPAVAVDQTCFEKEYKNFNHISYTYLFLKKNDTTLNASVFQKQDLYRFASNVKISSIIIRRFGVLFYLWWWPILVRQ